MQIINIKGVIFICTALLFKAKNSLFGRTLDVEREYGEEITVIPRGFLSKSGFKTKYKILSVAKNVSGYPLIFDGMNEAGLSMAGLNFPGNAVYFDEDKSKENLPSYDLILSVLGQFKNITEAKKYFKNLNITNEYFSETLPPSPLHWIVADKDGTFIVEQTKDGLFVFDNPQNVLTNNPPYPMQIENYNKFLNLTPNHKKTNQDLSYYSNGTGSLGLPGDMTSMSRFVRTVYNLDFAERYETNDENIRTFFDILGSVRQIKGTVILENGDKEFTKYTSCYDLHNKNGYFISNISNKIMVVDMNEFDCYTEIPFCDKSEYFKTKA